MIKANELRLGNLVFAFKATYQIDETDFSGEQISTYQPISITEEILLKCLFNKQSNYLYLEMPNGIELWYKEGVLYLAAIDCPNFNFASKLSHIKYVHQLQNLYFALTGEELTIKE